MNQPSAKRAECFILSNEAFLRNLREIIFQLGRVFLLTQLRVCHSLQLVMGSSYIPSTNGGLLSWLENFSSLITASPTTYGLVSGDATLIAAQNTAYAAAYAAANTPETRTSVTVAALAQAKAEALAVVRPYAVSISLNDAVTNEAKTAVGVTVRKIVPTPIPAPTATPALSFVSAVPLNTTLQARNVETPTSKAKPFGSIGVEVWDSVGTVAATDPAQLNYRFTASKIPFVRTFDSGDQGLLDGRPLRHARRQRRRGQGRAVERDSELQRRLTWRSSRHHRTGVR